MDVVSGLTFEPVVACEPVEGVVTLVGAQVVAAFGTTHHDVLAAEEPQRATGDRDRCQLARAVEPCRVRVAVVGHLDDVVRAREHVRRQVLGAGRVACDHRRERVAFEFGQEVEAGETAEVVEAVAVLQFLHLRLEHEVERRAEQPAERHLLLGETADPQVDGVEARDRVAGRIVAPVAGVAGDGRRVGAVEEGATVDRRARPAVDDCIGRDALVGLGYRTCDVGVLAVGGDEVDERLGVAQAEPEVGPARVRLEGRVAGRGEELLAHLVERRDSGVATTGQVDGRQVERKPQQVVAQRVGDELVDFVAGLAGQTLHDGPGGRLGVRAAGGELLRVEERLDQPDVVRRAVRVGPRDRLCEHRVPEAVDGVRELGDDRRVDLGLVAGEHVDQRLELAGELLEDEVLVLHLGAELGGLEESLAVPDEGAEVCRHRVDRRDQPLVEERKVTRRCGGHNDVLDVGHEPVVLRVEHVVDGGQADVLVAAAVTGHEMRVEQLVVVVPSGRRDRVVGKAECGVGVGCLALRPRVVRDVVEEGVTGADCQRGVDRCAGCARGNRRRDRRRAARVRHDLREAGIRVRDELAILVGQQERDVEDVLIVERDPEHRLRLCLDLRPVGKATRGTVEEPAGRNGLAGCVEHVLAVEHLVRRVRRVRLVLVDERRRLVGRLVDVVGASVRRGRVRVPDDPIRSGLVGGAGQRHEPQVGRKVVRSAGDAVLALDQRIVRLERDEDGAALALVDQVEAMVEELAEEREPRVVRRREARVRRGVRDEERVRVAREAVVDGHGARLLVRGGDCRRVVRRRVDDQVADHARLRVLDEALGRLVRGWRSAGLAGSRATRAEQVEVLRVAEKRARQTREHLVCLAEVRLAGLDVVLGAVNRPQPSHEQGVGDLERAVPDEGAPARVGLRNLDLLQDEVEVGLDERDGFRLVHSDTTDQKTCTQNTSERGAQPATLSDPSFHCVSLLGKSRAP